MENTFLVEKFLTDELNLSKKEITLYLNLVKYNSLTILELSEISGINRATTHINIENLTQKGLATQIKKGRGSRRLIMPEPPEKLSVLFTERKAKLEAAENQLGFIVQEIGDLKKEHKQSGSMEIRRYDGKEEVKLIYHDVLKADKIRSYFNYNKLIRLFPANANKFIETANKREDMHMWEIMEDSKEAREFVGQTHKEQYHCRLTTKKLPLYSLDYMIYDGKVAIIDAAEDLNGIVIENESFYKNAWSIHEFVWEFLPPYKG